MPIISAMATRAVRHEADHDSLTGLLNRQGFKRRFESWRGTHRDGGVIALIDFDHFKRVNDTLGHAEGDRLMVMFSTILGRWAKDPIVACRLGDEFALVAPNTETMRELLERTSHDFADHCRRMYTDVLPAPHPSFSAGLAVISADLSTSLKSADLALYRAKGDGRNRAAGLAS